MKVSLPFRRLAALAFVAAIAGVCSYPVIAGPLESLGGYFSAGSVEGRLEETLSGQGVSVSKIVKDYGALSSFYETRNFKPVWIGQGGKLTQAREFSAVLEKSWQHGLNPNSYHSEEIDALLTRNDPQSLVDLELLLSDAFVRLGQDLSGIRVNPRSFNTDRAFWRQPPASRSLLEMLGRGQSVSGLIAALEPQGHTYKRLQEELMRLVFEESPDYEGVLPIRIENFLHPYQRSAAVPALRARLGLPDVPKSDDPYVYDERTAASLIAFQRDNGLKADGVVGGQTLEILNRTRREKIEQIIANLERLRWVDEKKPDRFVVVNIPSATLWAIDGGRVSFDMPVIVGRSKRPTNMFITDITGVRFNPNWTVPPTIKKDDILPKLRQDPNYLAQKGMQLIYGRGEDAVSVDPASVDWNAMAPEELGKYRMVQTPGSHNPLGRVRVLMPNAYNVYLHDTNEPSKFNRAGRAESSGCVRMSEPEKMASFIMGTRPGWSDDQMQAYFDDGRMRDISIPQPIRIYMLYYTVWIAEDGRVIYGNDLYGYDNKLIKMLRNVDGIFIPVNNNEARDG